MLVETEEGELGLVAASGEASEAIDLFEAQARQGPCYEAYVEGRQVFEEDLAAAGQRWPDFAPRAAAAGFRAVAAFPLQLREEPIGAMNLFRSHPGSLEGADLHAAQALADLATTGLTCRRQLSAEEFRSEQLQTALDSRVVIEQAKGVIAERHGVGPGEAFETLRHHARSNNRILRQVAREVMDGDLEL